MTDPTKDLRDSQLAIHKTVAALELAGCDRLAIAAALFNAAGSLWRKEFDDEAVRRKLVMHAAEVAITGKPNP